MSEFFYRLRNATVLFAFVWLLVGVWAGWIAVAVGILCVFGLFYIGIETEEYLKARMYRQMEDERRKERYAGSP